MILFNENTMFLSVLTIVVLYGTAQCSNEIDPDGWNSPEKHFIYDVYKYNSRIEVMVNNSTEQILDFYEETDELVGYPTRVHVSVNDSVITEYPVFVTATQQKSVSSWELPLVVSTAHSTLMFDDMARTLCPHDAAPARGAATLSRPQIQVSTYSPVNVTLDIRLKRVQDFYVQVDKEVVVVASPSTPKYYYFSFDSDPPANHTDRSLQGRLPRFNYTIPKSVVLMVESEEDVCAIVSIQNNSCPVFDNEKDVLYQGYHLTMTTKGGITLTQSMFPRGFYVVFIVKETDEECVSDETPPLAASPRDRVKTFRFRVVATISYKEYVVGAAATLAALVLCAALVPLAALPAARCGRVNELVIEEEPPPAPSTSREQPPAAACSDCSDDDESLLGSIPSWPGALPPLTVAALSRARPLAHTRRSNRYFWSALTVAVVYALPVVQLLITYQQMVFQTGNQDLCYYNFLCAHPLGLLSDFNHVFSNLGYVVLGLAFMAQVSARSTADRLATVQGLGIPSHPGLFYSMGLALVMEGLLSASYHLCPNKMNFQFDSSFMYVIAVLCVVKLYQGRHPDVNASAHTTFMLLAVLITIGLFGIMYPSVYFWSLFTVLHLVTCFILTLNIYYVGQLKMDRSLAGRAVAALRRARWLALRPNYVARAVLLALANLANWALAAYGLYMHNKDFARHLLAILMGNAILYLVFYVIMKLIHRERLPAHTWLYLVVAHGVWFLALHLFLRGNTKWSETPAQSRRHNGECTALQFYDSHDLWHVASALALYLSFNVLLTVDDELRHVPRDQIPVF